MMKCDRVVVLCLLPLLASVVRAQPVDTIFAKGGTCLYKIYPQYNKCMEEQNARIARETQDHEPIYTRAKLIDSVNHIACCAYWDFVSCVQAAAREHCPGEKRDMTAYVRQLGSAVPVETCIEQYPRNSPQCRQSAAYRSSSNSLQPRTLPLFLLSLIMARLLWF